MADFYDVARAADIPEAVRLARTIRRWEEAVLAYYRSDRLSNARTEAINGLMKKIKRVGHGFRNLNNYRLRLLLHCGGVNWQHQPAARLEDVLPRSLRRAGEVDLREAGRRVAARKTVGETRIHRMGSIDSIQK
ncbi:MAG: transposase [Actinomycetota bacterium]|nr:transposase [Actinomycetota bacterium]